MGVHGASRRRRQQRMQICCHSHELLGTKLLSFSPSRGANDYCHARLEHSIHDGGATEVGRQEPLPPASVGGRAAAGWFSAIAAKPIYRSLVEYLVMRIEGLSSAGTQCRVSLTPRPCRLMSKN